MSQARKDREIVLGEGLPPIPERLLLAHARGDVLFICGAGVSKPAGLPNFRELVLEIYKKLDQTTYKVISKLSPDVCNKWEPDCLGLKEPQIAEVKRFIANEYDVVLGMLERRLDDQTRGDSQVRKKVASLLHVKGKKPASIHRSLMRLADRGGAVTIVTTNFDLLLEAAGRHLRPPIVTYSLGAIPRPTKQPDFSGVLHIHGALAANPQHHSELILSDQDFGEFYLRRRVAPDFIYDAARLFNLVLVGYSADDPPMRYLLNAVAADGTRFDDLKERFTFYGASTQDSVAMEDWRARGITPIYYPSKNNHIALHETFARWASLSAINGQKNAVERAIRQIVKNSRKNTSESDRDLFDHFFRRSNKTECVHLSGIASRAKASIEWLDAILEVGEERKRSIVHGS